MKKDKLHNISNKKISYLYWINQDGTVDVSIISGHIDLDDYWSIFKS